MNSDTTKESKMSYMIISFEGVADDDMGRCVFETRSLDDAYDEYEKLSADFSARNPGLRYSEYLKIESY